MLFDAGIDEQEIMSHTSHRSEKGHCRYKRATPAVIACMSAVLDPPPPVPANRIQSETATDLDSLLLQLIYYDSMHIQNNYKMYILKF